MLSKEVSIYPTTNSKLTWNTWRRLQNNWTWSHSSSVRAKLASFWHFSVFVSLLLSFNMNWLTNCSEWWVTTSENESEWQLTSCLVSALFSMVSVEPQQTFISISNCSAFLFFCSCISLNSCLCCEDDHAYFELSKCRWSKMGNLPWLILLEQAQAHHAQYPPS